MSVKRPMPPIEIESLECPVCAEYYDIETRRPLTCKSCGNSMCQCCVNAIKKNNNACPFCKTEVDCPLPVNRALLNMLEGSVDAITTV